MGFFKSHSKNKFNYTPRFYEGEGNPFEIKGKFDEHRKTFEKVGLKGKFANAWNDYKNTPDKSTNRRMLIIVGILVLLFLFIIEFDLSIFLPKN